MIHVCVRARVCIAGAAGRGGDELINVLEGLVLHCDIVDHALEKELIEWVEESLKSGLRGELFGETFMHSTFTDPVTGR